MRRLDHEQGTDEWRLARQGIITGTKAADLLNTLKSGKWATSRANTVATIALERLNTGLVPHGGGKATERGHAFEDDGRNAYAFRNLVEVTTAGLCLHSHVDQWGCSPDGLVSMDGALEIKVPTNVAKHANYLCDPKTLLEEYEGQCRHNLFITGRDWIDIASYHPEAPNGLHLAICRMERPDSWAEYTEQLNEAEAEIERYIDRLRACQEMAA